MKARPSLFLAQAFKLRQSAPELSTLHGNSFSSIHNSRFNLDGGSVRLDRPNGQSFVAGEFGTGTDVEFLSAAVRGGLVQLPLERVRLDFFGGQTTSGISETFQPTQGSLRFTPLAVRYDTKVFGAIATTQ